MRVVFVIGHDQRRGIGRRVQDAGGEVKQARGDLGHGHGRGGEQKADGLMGFGVEAEEGGGDLVGAEGGVVAVTRHLPLAGTGQAVRIDGEQAARKVAAGTTQATQGELQFLRLLHGMGLEQIVQAGIGDDKGQAVEEFEALLAEGAGAAKVHHSERGLMHELQGEAGGKVGGGRPGPGGEQVPGSQAQVLGRQQPEADQIAGNLIRQELADAAFEAVGIDLFPPILAQGAKGLQFHGGTLGVELIEFFFAARTEQ